MPRYTQIVILCEDRQQEVFARHFLVSCGVNRHRIRAEVAPVGLGSGERYVRKRYPPEVQAYRSRCRHLNIALAVLIDADMNDVEERLRQLTSELTEKSLAERQSDERIAIFVPRRNIETWIHYLRGETVNEVEVYPKLERESICKPLVAELAKNRHDPLPDSAPDSLKIACDELSRIL